MRQRLNVELRVTDPDQKERMAQLEERIEAARRAQDPKPRVDEHYSAANLAWRMVIELVAGLGIGFGIGYGLDSLIGTLPIFMVLFTMLGLAAGIKTMLRSATEIQEKHEAEEAERDERT
ncbi:AtpZ/AtpI family protein [Pelagimonas sp. KU-00592-HH]|jgi:ATP synthase protein I|uniref:AtpZ/AtpI family protein n=1 Tax=Roseobacteraceae TaxID=2854170 RepID=UPI0020CC18F6|nr:AtpZ/AtpI family protein [Shimia sp. CNT1-13L.2]MCP9482895.1 AtpZ/AtpI family protein [Shimia sp. CNT1-13L.2]